MCLVARSVGNGSAVIYELTPLVSHQTFAVIEVLNLDIRLQSNKLSFGPARTDVDWKFCAFSGYHTINFGFWPILFDGVKSNSNIPFRSEIELTKRFVFDYILWLNEIILIQSTLTSLINFNNKLPVSMAILSSKGVLACWRIRSFLSSGEAFIVCVPLLM